MILFTKFSQAARLYAENVEIVRQMEKAYEADARALVGTLEAMLKERLPDFHSKETSSTRRYWWQGSDVFGVAPYVWFWAVEPMCTKHDCMWVAGGYDANEPDLWDRLRELVANPQLKLNRSGEKPSRYELFEMLLEVEGDGALERSADRVADVLRAMNAAKASSG
jgi:hypothetical protein